MISKILPKCLFAALFSFVANQSFSQLYEVQIEEKIANSNLIVEGKVVDQRSFWNPAHTMIYTTNKVELYKVFKGVTTASFIEVLTQGGTVGNESIHASDLLELEKEHVGVFFCFPNSIDLRSPSTGDKLWDVYSSGQGYFNYNLDNETAGAPFVRYQSISTGLYNELTNKIGHGFENKKPSFEVTKQKVAVSSTTSKTLTPSIAAFTPATVNAGAIQDPANNLVTITGTGFGTFTGNAAVQFADGNNGGASYYSVAANDVTLAPLVVSWTDNEIQVRVPSRAGTGNIVVRDASGVTSTSLTPLNVFYSILTSTFNLGGNYFIRQLNLMNDDGIGGYTIYYSTGTTGGGVDITASPALQTFKRALNTWKETVGFNVTEGGNTSTQQINPGDNINAVMFDNTNTGNAPLASGVLAVCYSFSNICTDNPSLYGARKIEFDIVIRNTGVSVGSTSFTFGPCPPNATNSSQIDLESVIFHELGHALNLGHIIDGSQGSGAGSINPPKLMNYAVSSSTKRTSPDGSAKTGALYTCTQHNNIYGSCFTAGEMTQLTRIVEQKDDCPLVFPTLPTPGNTSVFFDMVHTSSNSAVDPALTQIKCAAGTAAVTNNAYYALRTNTSGVLSLSIANYTTTPLELATCPSAVLHVTTTGFRLLVYQVSSCPGGTQFPSPIACRDIEGNGALTDITGLTANTTYLIFIEAYENTKATFNMVLNGSALPIKLASFTGQVSSKYNNLDWVAESIININKLTIERSFNGTDFESIGEITGTTVYNRNGNFKDFKPAAGNNYYRLKIMNNNGSLEYSNIVLLKRNDKFLITINPNPAVGFAEVRVSAEAKGNYTLVLHNTNGQKVLSKEMNINAGVTVTRLDVTNLPKGIYSVSIFDQNQEKIKTILLSVQ